MMDGNNSLKRMKTIKTRESGDTRVLQSDYYLPTVFIDRYANEVKNAQMKGPQVIAEEEDDGDEEPESGSGLGDEETEEGDPTDGSGEAETSDRAGDASAAETEVDSEKALAEKIREACVVNWKAASADEKKRMWEIFDKCGVFACVCRHGFMLWLIDMVRSGEL